MKWEVPKSPSDIQTFLGLAGYYLRFIENFSRIMVPLNRLMKKSITFRWGLVQQAPFETLRKKLCEASILTLPEGVDDFVVNCDTSIIGLHAVLMQMGHMIAYASRQLKPTSEDSSHPTQHVYSRQRLQSLSQG